MHHIVSIDLYQQDLLVCFGDKLELHDALAPLIGEGEACKVCSDIPRSSVGRTMVDEERGVYFLWLPQVPSTAAQLGVLAHEIGHAAIGIMQKIGASLSPESEEAYTYLIQYLTERICEKAEITCACRVPQRSSKDAS